MRLWKISPPIFAAALLGVTVASAGHPGHVAPMPVADLRAEAAITDVAGLDDGSVIAAGTFWWANDRPTPGLVKLRPDGTVDASFAPRVGFAGADTVSLSTSLSPAPRLMALGDGRLMLASQQSAPDSWTVLATDGRELDDAFPTLPRGWQGAVKPQFVRDGWLYFIENAGLTAPPALKRVKVATGERDAAFSATHIELPVGEPLPLARAWPAADGKVWVAGETSPAFSLVEVTPGRAGIVRLLADGARDDTFSPVGLASGQAHSHRISAAPDGVLGRVTSDWSFFNYWPSPTSFPVTVASYGLAEGRPARTVQVPLGVASQPVWQSQGRVLATLTAPFDAFRRYFPDGVVDETFAAIPATGALFALPGGDLLRADGQRFTENGAPKSGWTPPRLRKPATCRALTAHTDDGGVFAVGDWVEAEGQPCAPLVRFRADGTRDDTFVPETPAGGRVQAISAGPGGTLLVVWAHRVGSRVVRLKPSGELDPGFAPYETGAPLISENIFISPSSASQVRALPDGGALVNLWQPAGDVWSSRWIRLSSTGQPITNPLSSYHSAGDALVLRDGRFWVDGTRYTAGGGLELALGRTGYDDSPATPRCELSDGRVLMLRGSVVKAIRPDGSTDDTWSLPAEVSAYSALHPAEGGKCFAVTERGIVRLHRNGRVDATFRPALAATEPIAPDLVAKALGWQSLQGTGVDFAPLWPSAMVFSGGNLWVGGSFTRLGGTRQAGVGRLQANSVTGYAAWADATIDDAAARGPEADPDGDGLTNALEWAQACDPLRPDAADGGLRLVSHRPACLSAPRNPEAPEAWPMVEASDDGRSWRAASGADIVLKGAGTDLTFEALGGARQRLFRVRFAVP